MRTGSIESNRVESWVEQGRIMSQTESDFRRNLRRSNEYYSQQSRIMGQTGSNHESYRVDRVEQGRTMSRTRSNHDANRAESWVEHGRTQSNHESNRVDRVKQGRIMMQTGPNHESNTVEHSRIMSRPQTGSIDSNKVESWVEHGQTESDFRRNLRRSNEQYSQKSQIMCQTGSNHESYRVDRVKQGRTMSQTRSNHDANRANTWVEHGRTQSNHESNRVDRVKQGRIMSRTGSNNESNRVRFSSQLTTVERII